ncbi:MAG: hypothetical protein VXZ40_00960 [Nanoarchaeota archaeon]|nr:hypothetical protein [Nanoarchaeota archaeon]
MKKAQNSLEFLSIFAIGIALTLIFGSFFFSISNSEKSQLDISQISRIGNEVISLSEEIYFRGSGNKIQYKAIFPENIQGLEIRQERTTIANYSEIRFLIISETGNLQNISFTPTQNYITLNCSNTCTYNSSGNFSYFNRSDFSAGPKTLSIRSIGDQVLIDFVR